MQRLVSDLNSVYTDTPALWSQDTAPEGFQWIEADDAARNTVAFVRWGSDGSALVCVTNFSAIPTRATCSACRSPVSGPR